MKSVPFVLFLFLASTVYAASPFSTPFKFKGYTCKNPSELTPLAREINADHSSQEKQSLLEISDKVMTIKTRHFRFKGYKGDYCEIVSKHTSNYNNGLLKGAHVNNEVKVSGVFEGPACEKKGPSGSFEKKVTANGEYLYLADATGKSDGTYCKSGQAFEVYLKSPQFEFAEVKRPAKAKKELDLENKLRANPQNVALLEQLAKFLFHEGRFDEAKVQVSALKAIAADNATAAALEQNIAKCLEEKDPVKRDELHAQLNAKPLVAAPAAITEVAKPAEAPAPAPKPVEAAAAPEVSPQWKDFLKTYPYEALKEKQYEAAPAEQQAHMAALEAYRKGLEESKKLLGETVKSFPNSPYLLEAQVNFLLETGDYDGAIKKFDDERRKYNDQINIMIMDRHLSVIRSEKDPGRRKDLSQKLSGEIKMMREQLRAPASKE